jgi:heme-degrading monooxygenase HmoA
MSESSIILRRWSGRLRSADEAECLDYVARTGADDYTRVDGYLGHQILIRTIGDGTSEITTLSWWRDMDAVRGFAGDQPERSVYYPEDDRYLIDKPEFVEHHRIFASDIRLAGEG